MSKRNLSRRDRRSKGRSAPKFSFNFKPNRHLALGVVMLTSVSVATVSIANNTAPITNQQSQLNTTVSQPGTGSFNVLSTQGGTTALSSDAGSSNTDQVANSNGIVDSGVLTNAQECASSPTGLLASANETTNNRIAIYSTSVNIDNIFKPTSSGGCFADIGKIVDLSVFIPDWTGIASAAANMLKQYAMKKVCNAVYQASSELLGPVNETIDKINKYGSALDVNGGFNEWANQELQKVDPELVLPNTPPSEEYSFDVGSVIKDQSGININGNANNTISGAANSAANSVTDAINSNTQLSGSSTTRSNASNNASALFGN